ncbi:uncharacterized protein LOC127104124 [Lathyrus oleraceus]|uniref:uncharacterized protein LOC127104124 n=1 Tax=Pisum sativum TaxID=3888 RepID=UPI0021CFFDB6|nr:uncharacterized protein LOC127104124 [Pisum sativum]
MHFIIYPVGLTIILAFHSVPLVVKLTSYFYNTRAKQKIAMERIEQNQTAMQKEMDLVRAQLGQLMDIMQNVIHRQEENRQANPGANVNMNAANPIIGNGVPIANQTHVEGMPNNPNVANTYHVPIHGGSQAGTEDHDRDFFMHRNESVYEPFGPPQNELERKLKMMDERVRAIEGPNTFGLEAADMCLVLWIKIPDKFKVPTFEKYQGNTCPKTHVRSYCRKMAAYSGDEKLLIHLFQDNLSRASLEWNMQLERSHVRSWRELDEAFLKHYQYNTDMAPNRTQLQSLAQKSKESFKEYEQRWRDLAARVQPPMLEKEPVDMFMGTLQGPYYEKLVGSTSAGFSDLVIAGERIKSGVKAGKIPSLANVANGAKKPYSRFPKKKEGETNAASTSKGKGKAYRTPYYQAQGSQASAVPTPTRLQRKCTM